MLSGDETGVCSGVLGAVLAGVVVVNGAGIVADGAECILVQPKYPAAATTRTIAAIAISLVLPPPSESCLSVPLPNEENVGGSTGAMCSFAGAGAAAAACPKVPENEERVGSAVLVGVACVEVVGPSVNESGMAEEDATGALGIACHGDFCFESSIKGLDDIFVPDNGSGMDSKSAASVGSGFT